MLARARTDLIALAVGTIAAFATPAAAAAEPALHAVVVGINQYPGASALRGAVADARDIAGALRGLGVQPTVLLDGQASRQALLGGLDAALDRARPGDSVLFTYAGHGAQQRARVPALESDGMDEYLVLGGFTTRPPGNGEMVLDDEIHAWTRRAEKKDVRVLLVFDACHSGTLDRSADPRAGRQTVRAIPDTALLDAIDPRNLTGGTAGAEDDDRPATNTFRYSAVRDDQKVYEIQVSGTIRGAFSMAFAQALRGAADADRDGWLSHGELAGYLQGTTRALAGGKQSPTFMPLTRPDEPVIRIGRGEAPSPPPATLRLAVTGRGAPSAHALAATLPGWTAAGSDAPADLVWDAERREAIDGMGDVIAMDVDAGQVPGVAGKVRALARLKAALAGKPALVMRALPNDKAHAKGAHIGFAVEGTAGRALTLFNLAGNGEVNLLYPFRASDPAILPGDFRLDDDIAVRAPFGADDVVALVTDRPPKALHDMLNNLNGKVATEAAADAVLATLAAETGGRMGLQRLVSVPR